MKKFIAALALFVGLSANANLISIELGDTNIAVGETVTVSLLAAGFADFDTFDFDFDFDTSVFSYDASTLLSDLSLGLLFDVNQVPDGMALSFFDFNLVNGDFLLASFDLIAVDEGFTNFTLSDAIFADGPVTSLVVDTSDAVAASVSVSVSAPATLSLFAIAILGLAGFRRKA
jgi:hypothetical protein